MASKDRATKDVIKIANLGLLQILISSISSDTNLITQLGLLGTGSAAALEFMKLVTSIIPNLISDRITKLLGREEIMPIEKAIKTAYTEAVIKIEDNLLKEKNLKESSFQKLNSVFTGKISDKTVIREIIHTHYFDPLKNILEDEARLANFLEVYGPFDIAKYIDYLSRDSRLAALFDREYCENISTTELMAYFKAGLALHFPDSFLKQLHVNEGAKIGYFKLLLELSIRELAALKQDVVMLKSSNINIEKALQALNVIAVRTNNTTESILGRFPEEVQFIEKLLIPTIEEIRINTSQIIQQQNVNDEWAPNLIFNLSVNTKINYTNALEYNKRYIPFIGRSREMSALMDFLDSSERFLWWKIEGAGGIGKSRIAMELCDIARKEGIYAGFYKLENSHLPDNDKRLVTTVPMLIVVDYALADQQKTINLLTYLQDKLVTLNNDGVETCKIRVLLIDRDFRETWYNSIGHLTDSSYLETAKSTLKVQDSHEDIRWSVIEHTIAVELHDRFQEKISELLPKRQEILNKLQDIDSFKRPLYAFLAAEALVYDEEENIRNWNTNDFLKSHFNRITHRVWQKVLNFEKHRYWVERLFLFNTLVRGLTKIEISEFLSNKNLTPDTQREIKDVYYVLADHYFDNELQIFQGLQPDILGEYFILNAIQRSLEEGGSEVKEILIEAWNAKADQAFWTTSLLIQDHLIDSTINSKAIVSLIVNTYTENLKADNAQFASSFLVNILGFLDFSNSEHYLDALKAIKDEFNTEPEITLTFASGLYNLFNNSKQHETKMLYFHRLKNVYEDNINDERIAHQYSMALFNLFNIEDKIREKQVYLSELELLHNKFGGYIPIGIQLAMGFFNMSIVQDDMNERYRFLYSLRHLNLSYKNVREISLRLARGTVFAIQAEIDEANIDISLKLLNQLVEDYERDEELSVHLSRGLLEAIQKKNKDIQRYIDELRQLTVLFSENLDIANNLAQGLCIYCEFADGVDIDLIVLELRSLSDQFNDKNLKTHFICGVLCLLLSPIDEGKKFELFDKISEAIFLIDDNLVANHVAMLMFEITRISYKDRFYTKMLDELEKLYQRFSSEKQIASYLAMAVFNFVLIKREENEIEDLLGKLQLLHNAFPMDELIALQLSKCLLHNCNVSKSSVKRQNYLDFLQKLHEMFKSDQAIALHLAYCHFNMEVSTSDHVKRQHHATEVEKLRDSFRGIKEFEDVFTNAYLAQYSTINVRLD